MLSVSALVLLLNQPQTLLSTTLRFVTGLSLLQGTSLLALKEFGFVCLFSIDLHSFSAFFKPPLYLHIGYLVYKFLTQILVKAHFRLRIYPFGKFQLMVIVLILTV